MLQVVFILSLIGRPIWVPIYDRLDFDSDGKIVGLIAVSGTLTLGVTVGIMAFAWGVLA